MHWNQIKTVHWPTGTSLISSYCHVLQTGKHPAESNRVHVDHRCSLIRLCIHTVLTGRRWDHYVSWLLSKGPVRCNCSCQKSSEAFRATLKRRRPAGKRGGWDVSGWPRNPERHYNYPPGWGQGGVLRSWHPHFNWVRNSRGTTLGLPAGVKGGRVCISRRPLPVSLHSWLKKTDARVCVCVLTRLSGGVEQFGMQDTDRRKCSGRSALLAVIWNLNLRLCLV